MRPFFLRSHQKNQLTFGAGCDIFNAQPLELLGGNYKLDINKFDKEFAEKREGGAKWWFNYVITWFWGALAWFFAILGIIWEVKDFSQGGYISLLSVLFSLFGIQSIFKCRTWNWNLRLIIPLVFCGLALVLTAFLLYIYMPIIAE